jgi:hypothetical protein
MPVLNRVAITRHRQAFLAKVEAFTSETLAEAHGRCAKNPSFWFFMDFCSPMVFNLITWEQIHQEDLEQMPSLKKLIAEAASAARSSISSNGSRYPELGGQGRRTFNEIGEVELAANILPRLEQILHIWGITFNEDDGSIQERKLTEEESARLTKYFGNP